MKNLLLYTIIGVVISLVSCTDENQILPENHLIIPNDILAFYLIEGYQEIMNLNKITNDSIKEFGNRIIGYRDIVSYDISGYVFEITGSGKENIDSILLARYAHRNSVAAISEGEILFCVYINHPALSSTPNWFYLEPYTLPPWTKGYLYFCLPPFADIPIEPDFRKDTRMLQVLGRDNKLK